MKKLLLTLILVAACRITFASIAFGHERGGYRHHVHGYNRAHNCYRPEIIIAARPFARDYINPGPRIWVEGHWIFGRRGREIWIPGHWRY